MLGTRHGPYALGNAEITRALGSAESGPDPPGSAVGADAGPSMTSRFSGSPREVSLGVHWTSIALQP